MDFDFLSDFVSPPSAADTTSTTVQTNGTNDDYFAQHFWVRKIFSSWLLGVYLIILLDVSSFTFHVKVVQTLMIT